MPLYEYRCTDCGNVFEELQPMDAPRSGALCTQCGGSRTNRLLSSFAVHTGATTTEAACPKSKSEGCPHSAMCNMAKG